MNVPKLIHPVVPADHQARAAGCTCNRRSSQRDNHHDDLCPLYLPNPGSDGAIQQGCTCPVLDNGHGNEKLGQTRGFWFSDRCPLHFQLLCSSEPSK